MKYSVIKGVFPHSDVKSSVRVCCIVSCVCVCVLYICAHGHFGSAARLSSFGDKTCIDRIKHLLCKPCPS
jgi:hypothetical protein